MHHMGPCVDIHGLGRGGMHSGRESDKVHVMIQVEGLIGARLIGAMRAAVLAWPEKCAGCVMARDASLHALPPSPCTRPPILETNIVNLVSTVDVISLSA